jgi:hypothetical protein
MHTVYGLLVSCDLALKEIYLLLDNDMHFIIEDFDEGHLFVKKDAFEKARLKAEAIILNLNYDN